MVYAAFKRVLPNYLEKLDAIRENSSTAFSYGPSLRTLLDKHGPVIRTDLSPDDIMHNYLHCNCKQRYADYVDRKVGHVRTTNTNIIPGFNELLDKGLNHRVKVSLTTNEIFYASRIWFDKVIKKFRSSIVRAVNHKLRHRFEMQLARECSKKKLRHPTEKEWP